MKPTQILLVGLVLASIFVNLPNPVSAEIKLAGRHFKWVLERPELNLSFIGLDFKRDLLLHEGLDLQGGSHLVFEADMKGLSAADRQAALEAVKANIERRINYLGVAEPMVQTASTNNSYRLVVEMAGIKDVKQAISLIGTTAQLDFREIVGTAAAEGFRPTGVMGRDLKKADVAYDPNTNAPEVGLEFTSEGSTKFAAVTKKNLNKPLAIYLDDRLIGDPPVVSKVIEDGRAVITGRFTTDEVKTMVRQLNSGALPVSIKLIEERTVGATLGADSVKKSMVAGAVGLGVVGLFMIFNYGFLGLLADVALVLYILFSLAIFRLVPVTMTLAGIAGFILSIGMAVDANILIFERIKEEIRWGKGTKTAFDLGFSRAWMSIRDSNVSSLITCFILFWFGSGSVRGFSLTLAIGIGVSLYTAINVSRRLLGLTDRFVVKEKEGVANV